MEGVCGRIGLQEGQGVEIQGDIAFAAQKQPLGVGLAVELDAKDAEKEYARAAS
jgi:hypothetical protein